MMKTLNYQLMAASALVSLFSAMAEASDKPNFVIIFSDDQGYEDVGCFGSPDIELRGPCHIVAYRP
ncbi:MAG: hypothetical protein CMJ78_12040 [Planctomycetaceae bacterium]|nr:hypothetical protein [Planctomycetaceae bacterium]